jgi:opacity protein-like surface antigen
MKKFAVLSALVCGFTAAALAADVAGKWTAQVPGRDGQTREATFQFSPSGENLTGTMSTGQGDVQIADGKVAGDTITFKVTMERGGNTITWNYTGKVAGDEIQFKREGTRGQPREFVAKRVK